MQTEPNAMYWIEKEGWKRRTEKEKNTYHLKREHLLRETKREKAEEKNISWLRNTNKYILKNQ